LPHNLHVNMVSLPMLEPGTIIFNPHAYIDPATQTYRAKYLLILAYAKGGHDLVWRLLTSRSHSRPEQPKCYHGLPYPGFYLGVISPKHGLGTKSWLDLRFFPDGDLKEIRRDVNSGILRHTCSIEHRLLKEAALCVAGADDTSAIQESSIRDHFSRQHRAFIMDDNCFTIHQASLDGSNPIMKRYHGGRPLTDMPCVELEFRKFASCGSPG